MSERVDTWSFLRGVSWNLSWGFTVKAEKEKTIIEREEVKDNIRNQWGNEGRAMSVWGQHIDR